MLRLDLLAICLGIPVTWLPSLNIVGGVGGVPLYNWNQPVNVIVGVILTLQQRTAQGHQWYQCREMREVLPETRNLQRKKKQQHWPCDATWWETLHFHSSVSELALTRPTGDITLLWLGICLGNSVRSCTGPAPKAPFCPMGHRAANTQENWEASNSSWKIDQCVSSAQHLKSLAKCEIPYFKNILLRWTSLPTSPCSLNGQPTASKNTTENAVQEKLIRLQFAEQIDINKGGNSIQDVSQWCLVETGGRAPAFCPKQTSREVIQTETSWHLAAVWGGLLM